MYSNMLHVYSLQSFTQNVYICLMNIKHFKCKFSLTLILLENNINTNTQIVNFDVLNMRFKQ